MERENSSTNSASTEDWLRVTAGMQISAAIPPSWVVEPAFMVEEQAWFWTPQWHSGEEEADEDLVEGRFTRYNSSEEFMESLG